MTCRKVKANPKAESSPQNSIKGSPNAVLEVQKLKELLEAEKEKGQFRDETISLLKDDNTYLQGELKKKDELIHQLVSKKDEDNSTIMSGKSGVKRKHGNGNEAKQLMSIASDKEDEDSSSVLSDSSEARNTRSIVARYKMAMDAFNRGGSMKAAFETIGADRNTVSRTAPIAEISIAAPEIFRNVGAWDERKEKLSTFIERCRSAMTPEVKEKILKMKQEGTLLPIATQV
ncbi:coiled-coil domain-containing protein 106-like [Seriola aureovittata]|uniref:coiled-coil domain-containing protein 106-like n=1 Tax=Seriola aureovittata TaxID=2871759 RepID=UPI0024BDFBC0|nr:coiled-coil domain-containing protein 106-like [Seriola aureovittata]